MLKEHSQGSQALPMATTPNSSCAFCHLCPLLTFPVRLTLEQQQQHNSLFGFFGEPQQPGRRGETLLHFCPCPCNPSYVLLSL